MARWGRAFALGTLTLALTVGNGREAAADRGRGVRTVAQPAVTAARRSTPPRIARQGRPQRQAGTRPHRRPAAAGYATVAEGRSSGISCVPYARSVTGMQVSGNGNMWWHNAAGLYARGQRPEPGSVMAFPGSGGMARGHVAVVSRVLGPRQVQIDHANWGGPGIARGSVMHGVNVVDVSEANDWTAVRVQVGYDTASLGRTYPTYGFIYNRPDYGAGSTAFAGLLLDQGRTARRSVGFEQVAELPSLRRAAAASVTVAPTRRPHRR